MKGIIDRFEGDYAIVELDDKKMINIEKSKIPEGAGEGTVIIISEDKVMIDEEATQKIKKEVQDLMDNLFQ